MKTAFVCTPENPWPADVVGSVQHTGAYEVGKQEDGYPGGDIITMRCPNCGHTWKVELAQ